ncbi:RNA-dependent RNA Polymerase [Rosellinia necatrix partitivirus 7]|nr:RNA-dependent RNA Polymerase [Rosellinia necatrix partitivirus 7]
MPNLTFIRKLNNYEMPKRYDDDRQQSMDFRNQWLERQMRKFFTKEEIDQVLTNRRSDYSDEALINDFKRCEHPYHEIPLDYNVQTAIDAVTEQFRPNRVLHPIQYPDLRYYPWTLNVSAEAPWTSYNFHFVPMDRSVDFESTQPKLIFDINQVNKLRKFSKPTDVKTYLRWKQQVGLIENDHITFHNLYDEIFIYNRPLIHQIKEGEEPFWKDGQPVPYLWNTLHVRSHVVAHNEPDKLRGVFGATKLVLQTEQPFIWPLQASYLNTDAGRLLWGREMSKGGWRKLFSEIYTFGPPSTVLSTDWSQFDKRLLHQLIRIVHRIWRSYFDFTRYEPTNQYPNANPRDPKRLERLWDWMCNAITDTPILLPNGEIWRWQWNGFGSGYQQTQLMDTFANAIMIYTCLTALGVDVTNPKFWARFQGDDSLVAFFEQMFRIYGNDFLIMFSAVAEKYFNAKLNVKKSSILGQAHMATVLSYPNWHGTAFRTDEDLLRHLMFPERPQDLGRLAASAIGLAQAALGCSERFHNLCEYIFTKLVKGKGVKVKWQALKWMVRAGQFETIEQLKRTEFPTIEELLSQAQIPAIRTESERQRIWRTTPLSKDSFHFTHDI